MKRVGLFFLLLVSHYIFCLAQPGQNVELFRKIVLQTDSGSYSNLHNTIEINKEKQLWFEYYREDQVCHVMLYPDTTKHFKLLGLEESGDFDIIDSLRFYNHQYYDFKIRFKHLTKSEFLKFSLKYALDTSMMYYDVNLFPVFKTTAHLDLKSNELNVGEEKVVELITNNVDNIKVNPGWDNSQDVNYRITANNGHLYVHLVANATGNRTLTLHLHTYKPYLSGKNYIYDLDPLTYTFNVKAAGLVYLHPDKTDIQLDDNAKQKGVLVQMDNNHLLQLNKTYLVEEKEKPGSPLIATLFFTDRISDSKVTGLMRIYNLHRQSDGYLYIKDGDVPKFITNFNIIPRTTIEHIKIMRNGKDWVENDTVYPGETINLRIEGQSLSKARFRFDPLIQISADSAIRNDHSIEYKLKVPIGINKKSIEIYNYNHNTGSSLYVKEYQVAKPFDYVNIRMGGKQKNLNDFQGPEFYSGNLKDVIVSFLPNKIDEQDKLYGKQYLDMDVKVYNKDGELKDFATVNDLAVCPGDNSPRYSYYDKSDCTNSDISLNSNLNNPVYNLKEWSKIHLTFKDQKSKYSKAVQSKSVDIVLQKLFSIDIDVSFPTGLLIKRANEGGFGDFSGVSMAILEQCSFYAKEKFAKLEPYKVGVGFIALNAFDFNQQSSNRDMGIVMLGTLNPVNMSRKLTFPIYLGGGYLLSQKTWFWLLGPGISVQF